MAKKNLASLMVGIMGDHQDETDSTAVSSASSQDNKLSAEEMQQEPTADISEPVYVAAPASQSPVAETPAKRRGPGRPRKNEGPGKIEEVRATFIVDARHIKKIKYISLAEGCLLKDVVDKALNEYIAAWEAENGRIKLPGKKS